MIKNIFFFAKNTNHPSKFQYKRNHCLMPTLTIFIHIKKTKVFNPVLKEIAPLN